MKIKKTLCELKQNDFENLEKELIKIVKSPKFICKKCFRAASAKDYLCNPKKIK